jgi:hypothetical protein
MFGNAIEKAGFSAISKMFGKTAGNAIGISTDIAAGNTGSGWRLPR